jgi:hypothetical protein
MKVRFLMSDESSIQPFGDNFIPVIPVEYSYHTQQQPFCWDSDCPCHTDTEAIAHVQQEYEAGLLTAEEAIRTIKGEML